jgi:hypothetical protein
MAQNGPLMGDCVGAKVGTGKPVKRMGDSR